MPDSPSPLLGLALAIFRNIFEEQVAERAAAQAELPAAKPLADAKPDRQKRKSP